MIGGGKDLKRRPYIPRPIQHPDFQNATREEARKLLIPQRPGDVIIRPSSSGPARLTFTYKLAGAPVPEENVESVGDGGMVCFHLGVEELEKPTPLALGDRLMIGDREFEDLDEIISRFIQPIVRQVYPLTQHEKFCSGGPQASEKWLAEQRARMPKRIHYCFSLDEVHSCVVFSYLPGSSAKTVNVGVTPKGFRFRGTDFSLKDLIPELKIYLSKKIAEIRNQRSRRPAQPYPGTAPHYPPQAYPSRQAPPPSYSQHPTQPFHPPQAVSGHHHPSRVWR